MELNSGTIFSFEPYKFKETRVFCVSTPFGYLDGPHSIPPPCPLSLVSLQMSSEQAGRFKRHRSSSQKKGPRKDAVSGLTRGPRIAGSGQQERTIHARKVGISSIFIYLDWTLCDSGLRHKTRFLLEGF